MSEAEAIRAKRYRDRKAGKAPGLAVCPTCGKSIRKGDYLPLCQRCWLKTPRGLEYIRTKTRESRARTKAKAQESAAATNPPNPTSHD